MSDIAKICGMIGGGVCLLGGLILLLYYANKPQEMMSGAYHFCLPLGLYCIGNGLFLISSAFSPSKYGN